jgi:Glycosyltransferase family 87
LLAAGLAVAAVLLVGYSLVKVGDGLLQGGGRVYANPACIPETAPKCDGRSDVFPRLLGTHLAIAHHESPYSPALKQEMLKHLSPADSDLNRFYYPMWTVVLLAPLTPLSYAVAGATFTWITTFAFIALLALLARQASNRRLPLPLTLAGASFLVYYLPQWQVAAYLQQPSLLLGGIQAWLCFALLRRQWITVGVLAALSTFKPQFAVFGVVIALVVLLVHDRSRRGLYAFAATMGGLLAISFALAPRWVTEFIDETSTYNRLGTPLSVAEQIGLSRGLTILAVGAVLVLLSVGVVNALGKRDAPLRLCMAFAGASALSLLAMPRITLLVGAYDHLILAVPGVVLLGAAVARPRWGITAAAILALFVQILPIIYKYQLGASKQAMSIAISALKRINTPIPAGFEYGAQAADYILQTYSLGVVILLSILIAHPVGRWSRAKALLGGSEPA